MHLARHAIQTLPPTQVIDARFDADANIFTTSTPSGFAVYRTHPLALLSRREFSPGGSLTHVLPVHSSSLLYLVGGGADPLFPPNKVVVWDDKRGKAVAEMEFRERVRGICARRGWLIVALRRRVVAFEVGETITKYAEWETGENLRGLVAIATTPRSTLLAVTGKQTGHVQLIHLPPCRPPAPTPNAPQYPSAPSHSKPSRHSVSIIAAHTSSLAALAVLPSGRLLATASDRGTLIRVWDAHTGKLVRELRRGSDKAEIYGIAFRPDEQDVCVWSDKGTVHIFSLAAGSTSNQQSKFSPLSPFLSLPKYFDSEWSYAQYRIPSQLNHIALSAGTSGGRLSDAIADERCTVAWVPVEVSLPPTAAPTSPGSRKGKEKEKPMDNRPRMTVEYQMIALTYSGGWYRLGLPNSSSIPLTPARPSSAGAASSTSYGGARSPGKSKTPLPQHMKQRRSSGSTVISDRSAVGSGKEKDGEKEKVGRECALLEFRRFGRWDGWG